MTRIKMERVEDVDPAKMTIFVCEVTPAMRGDGDTDYLCAGCQKTMLRKVTYKQVQNIIFKCPHCGTYSRIATAHHAH